MDALQILEEAERLFANGEPQAAVDFLQKTLQTEPVNRRIFEKPKEVLDKAAEFFCKHFDNIDKLAKPNPKYCPAGAK